MRQRDTTQHRHSSGGSGYEDEHPTALHIQLLGQFQVTAGSRVIPDSAWRVQKARSLVKVLCLASRCQLHREQLIDLLWPELDPDAISGNLRSVVHAARRALDMYRPEGMPSLLQVRQDVFVLGSGEPITIDVELFKAAAEAAFASRNPRSYQAALDLYTGDLLPEDRYEDWAASAREDLRETFLRLLVSRSFLHESRGEFDPAINALEQAIATDATHEDVHAGLMRLYATTGRHGQALRQFARLRDVLARELDVEPSGAIQRLHAEIAAGEFAPQHQRGHAEGVDSPSSDHNLPAALTRFIGRRAELDEINLSLRDARLVTLVGPGGSGKSRLAVEAAREMIPEAGAIRLVELAALTDPALVPGAVAAAFGVMDSADQPLVDALINMLQGSSILLVLDNCEHLIDACASLVEMLLAGVPGLRVLATSREALRIPGEVLWRVSPLPLPESSNGGPLDLERLAGNDAVSLFIDRARWVRPGFALTAENAAAITQICHRLDGMPLALELAAARSSVLSPEQLAERLDDALRLLAEGSRTAPDRQQTLRATLDWSYALLSPGEQALLQRLSVFAGGWNLEAAESICAGDSGNMTIETHQVLTFLAHLVDKSLVQVEDSPTNLSMSSSLGVRYSLLETVRQYAAMLLTADGDDHRMASRHAEYYLQMAERARPALTGPEQATWLQRLEQEHDNLRAALRRLAETGHIEAEARLCDALWRFWVLHGYLAEGSRWLNSLLERSKASTLSIIQRARLFEAAGTLAWRRGEVNDAERLSRHALVLFEEAGEQAQSAGVFHNLGAVAELRNDYPAATRYYREALRIREETGDSLGVGVTLNNLGNVAREQGYLDEAAELYTCELEINRAAGYTRGVALALAGLSVVALDSRDYPQAERVSRESINLYQSVGRKSMNPMVLQNLGYALMYQHQHRPALEAHAEGLRLFAGAGDMRGVACALEGLIAACVLYDPTPQGVEVVARLLGATEALRAEINVPITPADFALIQRPLDAAREVLGATAFDTARSRGTSLSPETAVAEALSWVEHLLATVSPPVAGTPALSQRERDVTKLLAQGQTNAQIAAALNIARPTVDKHVSNILRKLGFSSRSDVRAWATEQGLVPADSTSD